MKKAIIFLIFFASIFCACSSSKNGKKEWASLIYPDKNNTKRSKKNGIYPTLKECQNKSKKELKRLDLLDEGYYQCALNCTFNEHMKIDICEKLSK